VKEFVFGEKLNDRVTINLTKNGTVESIAEEKGTTSSDTKPYNSIKRKSSDAEDQDSNEETTETTVATENTTKTLWSENNVDYFDPNENNENTLFKINCKLYLLEADKANWVERGYGILKVIDSNDDLNCNISELYLK
jgi:hypothetical protein